MIEGVIVGQPRASAAPPRAIGTRFTADRGVTMRSRLRELSYRIEQNRRVISRVLLIFLLAMLQTGGGLWLYSTDVTRGTPAIIQSFGIEMHLFSAVMLTMGLLTLALLIVMLMKRTILNAARMCFLTTPFILYIMFTAWGVTHELQSGQGFYFYIIFYLIAMIAIWGSD